MYFIKSKYGASRWERLLYQFTFDEHEKVKQKWKKALSGNSSLRNLAGIICDSKSYPEWVVKVGERYKKLIALYEKAEGEKRKEIYKEIVNIKKRYGL